MEQRQPLLPGIPHKWAIAYLRAVRNHYQEGVTRPPTDSEIAAAHDPPIGLRTWSRRKQRLRGGSLGRDWLEGVWPPPRDWHPSWESLVDSAPVTPAADDAHVSVAIEVFRDGKFVEKVMTDGSILRYLPHLSTVAAIFMYAMLDQMLDGRLDGILHAACFGQQLIHAATRLVA